MWVAVVGNPLMTFTVKQKLTDLTQQLRQTQHLSCEHSQADEDGVELADGASDVPRSDLPQVHGKHAESYTYEEEQGFRRQVTQQLGFCVSVHFFVVSGIEKMENQIRIVVLIVLDPLWQKSISESGQWSSPTPKQVSASQRLMRVAAQETGLEMIARVWISVSCPQDWPQRKVWQWRPELEENGDPMTSKQPSLSGRVGF